MNSPKQSLHHLYITRYTAVEVLGLAVCKLFPAAKLLSGGVNESGFYYDFAPGVPLNDTFLTLMEEAMHAIAREGYPIKKREMMRENAVDFFLHRQQPLKAELVEQVPYNIVQLIEFAGFFDLAPPFYAESTGCVSIFKLYDLEQISCSSSEKGSVTAFRVTGEVFEDKQQLKKFTKHLRAYKEESPAVLMKAMELFDFNDRVSDLQSAWLPKGAVLLDLLLAVWQKENRFLGVLPVKTAQLIKSDLFRKNEPALTQEVVLEVSSENENYRAMQAPAEAHAYLFMAKPRQMSELPVRYSEVKDVFVEDAAMTQLTGILKSPSQLIDFTHSFCAPEQLREELISSLQFFKKMGTILGLGYEWTLCSRKGKSTVRQKHRDQAVVLMREVLAEAGCVFTEDTLEIAAFGPSLRGDYIDRLGRRWRGPELTVDFHLPTHLGLCYTDSEGRKVEPILLRRIGLGPLERLIALLVEKDKGELPLWLTPEQVRVIAVGDAQIPYANVIVQKLRQAGIRVMSDPRSLSQGCSLGTKIHACECAKVPYALIVGAGEEREKVVNVRKCGDKSTPLKMDLDLFLEKYLQEPCFSAPEMKEHSIATEAINRSLGVES